MKLKITYMSGAGNIFSVIDNREYNRPADYWSAMAHILCHNNIYNTYPTEGLLIINSSNEHDFDVEFFNPDGSKDMMCGNGGRCAIMFAGHEKFLSDEQKMREIVFKMAGGIYKGKFTKDKIRLYLPPPCEITKNVKILVKEHFIEGIYINVNSDHFCIDQNDHYEIKNSEFRDFCIDDIAPSIRFHEYFNPNGVNVNIYKIESRNRIQLRTYERGVESETGACGTGALSTALAALTQNKIDLPVTVIPPSQSPLLVDIEGSYPNNLFALILEGSAEIKLQTEIDIPDNLFNTKELNHD